MNYQQIDAERIRKVKQIRNTIGNNSGDIGYSQSALNKLAKGQYANTDRKPNYTSSAEQKKLTPQLNGVNTDTDNARRKYSYSKGYDNPNDLRNRGYESTYKSFNFSRRSDNDLDMLDADLWDREERRKRQEKRRNAADDSPAARFYDWQDSLSKPNEKDNLRNKQSYIDKYGASKDEVLDAYSQYKENKERKKREEHPFLEGLKDLPSALQRGLESAGGSLSRTLFPNSDLEELLNSDTALHKVKEVEKKRNYSRNSSKLTDRQKNALEGLYQGGDFLASAIEGGALTGGGAVFNPDTGALLSFEPSKALPKIVNAVSDYGLGSQGEYGRLTRQGVDAEKAQQMANVSGALAAAGNAIMRGNAVKNGASVISNLLRSGGIAGGVGLGQKAAEELAENLILENESTYSNDIDNYLSKGMTEEQAGEQAAIDLLGRVGGTGATGFLMGAGTSAISQILPQLASKAIGSNDPYADLNSVWATQNALPQNDIPLLTGEAVNTQNIGGEAYAGLPEFPSVIQMPGTNGVINLPGETATIYLPDTLAKQSLPEATKVLAESRAQNPRYIAPLQGEELAAAKETVRQNKARISAQKDAIKILENDKSNYRAGKLKKAVKEDIANRKAEIQKLTDENTATNKNIKGGIVPVKDLLSDSDRNNIYSNQNGVYADINYTVKFAGDTKEAKQLGKEAKKLLNNYVESGDMNDAREFLMKVADLDSLAFSTNADYKTGSGNVWNYANFFGTNTDNQGNEYQIRLLDSILGNHSLEKIKDFHDKLNAETISAPTQEAITPNITADAQKNNDDYTDPVDKALTSLDFYETHTPEEVAKAQEYVNSTDEQLLDVIKRAKSGEKVSYQLDITPRMADDIYKTTGLNTEDHSLILDDQTIRGHIEKRHGKKGKADTTMADDNTLARIQYILNNYDEVFKGRPTQKTSLADGSQAPVTVFVKKIDGNYCVLEAVSDAKTKKSYIVSAYIANDKGLENSIKKGSFTRVANVPDNSVLPLTSETGRATSFDNNINLPALNVNNETQEISNGYWLRLLGDDNYLQTEAVKNNISPDELRNIAASNLGYEVPSLKSENISEEAPKRKVSQTYTNTGKHGGGWNEEEYEKYTDPNEYMYDTIDEKESVERATKMRRDEGREAFKERVLKKDRVSSTEIDGLMMEWRELTEEARALESSGEDATELWKESNRIFKKIKEQSNSNAQALQALAKWSRNTPEGMLMEAQNILNGKTKVEETPVQKILNKFQKDNKGFEFSEDFMKDFLDKAEEISGLSGDQLDTPEAKRIMAELGRMVNEQLPPRLGEKVTAYLMDNMLGNFRTLITRNAGGNVGLNIFEQTLQRPLAAAIDSLVSLKSGKRTQAGLSREGLAEYIQGFSQGIKDEISDLKSGLHTARTGENTLERAISANRHVFKSKVFDKADSLVKNGLSVGDRPFYEAVYKQTLGDYNRLYEKGVMGDDIQNLNADQFDELAKTAAKLNALGAVYQKDTLLSNALLGFKRNIGDLSRGITGVDILSQFSMPFVKTPANVVDVAIDYSPLGFVRNAAKTGREIHNDNFDQNRFANETARNILGTSLMAGAGALAAKGVLSGSYSDDKDEKQAQKESGEQEHALNLPNGNQLDIGWLPVVGSNSVAAAATQDAIENGNGKLGEDIAAGLYAGGKSLFDQSMFQGLQRLFGGSGSYNSDEGIVGNMTDVVKSGLGQGIPSLVRQIGQVIDPYQRDLAGSNKDASFASMDNYDINSLVNNIPYLREQKLAPKVSTSGELQKENQGRSVGMKVLENMILPGKITKVEYSKLNEEANRLKKETTSADAYMPKVNRNNVDTDEHTLTNDEWTKYQQKYYKAMTDVGTKIIKSDEYKSANADEQVKTLKYAYDAVKNAINSEYNGKELTGAAKQYKEAGGGEKGVNAVVKYYSDSIKANELGLDVKTYQKKEKEYPGGAKQFAKDKEQADKLGLSVDTYTKKQKEYPGGAEQYAKDNKEAKRLGIDVDTYAKKEAEQKGSAEQYAEDKKEAKTYDLETDTYNKIVDKAGDNADKVLNAVPGLKRNGLGRANVYYQFADALKEIPSLTSGEFARQYNEINVDGSKGISQKELLTYLDNKGYDDEKANQMWNAYGGWTNKAGQKKKIKKGKNGKWTSYY